MAEKDIAQELDLNMLEKAQGGTTLPNILADRGIKIAGEAVKQAAGEKDTLFHDADGKPQKPEVLRKLGVR